METCSRAFDAQSWQRHQMIALGEIFENAAEELEAAGVRLLMGSLPAVHEDSTSIAQITLRPTRFSKDSALGSVALRLSATATNGPGRYIIAVTASGAIPNQAIDRLLDKNSVIWQNNYISVGLWIHDGERTDRLSDLEQLTMRTSSDITISGVILHTSSRQAIQVGLMSMAVLYRSLLDEISEASQMAKLANRVLNRLDGQRPAYERVFRP